MEAAKPATRASVVWQVLRSPHGPTSVGVPLLRATINVHLVNFAPGNRTVHQTDVAARGTNVSGGGTACVGVRGVGLQDGPAFSVRSEVLPITGGPIVHVGHKNQGAVVGQFLGRNPSVGTADGRPGRIDVATVVVVADDVTVLFLFERPITLLVGKILAKIGAFHQTLGGDILDDRVTDGIADEGQMIVVGRQGWVRGSRENLVAVVPGIHVCR